MVSKGNKKYLMTKQERLIPHYGLRKLSVGVASVLLSTSILMGMTTKAQADTATGQVNQESSQTDKASDNNATNSVTLKNYQAPTEASSTQKQDQVPAKSTIAGNASQQAVQPAVTPTTSINDQVGKTINVVTHDVTETTGGKATGQRGTTNLELKMTISADDAQQIKAGDYIDIRLGMPYTTEDGNSYVFSYGAVNNSKDNIKALKYQNHVIGYIVPAGDTESYKQSFPEASSAGTIKWTVINNQNKDDISSAGSNGYYRIIFNDVLSDYLKNHSGNSGVVDIKARMAWYNTSSNGDKQALKPSETITLYSDNGETSYSPQNDLQIGNQTFTSGISINVIAKKKGESSVPVTSKPQVIDHTGNTSAHLWRTIDGKETLQVTNNQAQGVGIPLTNLGQNFTITVTKPASNDDVTTNFVSASDLQEALQNLVVPLDSKVSSNLVDKLIANGNYYLSDQFVYPKPKVNVTVVKNDENKITYHVTVAGDYKGFKVTSAADGIELSPITLITWMPTRKGALLPEKGINNSKEDHDQATYFNQDLHNWLYGYSIRDRDVRNYMNTHPWHVTVTSQNGNYDTDCGYWIDMETDSKPVNQADVNSTFYGFVNQTIHYVDADGNQMMDDKGKPIADRVRQVTFTSDTGASGSFKADKYFSDIDIPGVKGYSTYRGQKSDGKKIIYSGGKITKIGDEGHFTYPHNDFIEYVVYVKNSEPTPVNPQPDPKPKPDPEPTPEPIPVKDSKTITEAIHYVYRDGTKAADDKTQQVIFTRNGSQTAEGTTWDDWTPAEGIFAEVESPEIKGYIPDLKVINKIKVTSENNNIVKTVIYTKNSIPTPEPQPTPAPAPKPTPEPQPTSTPTPAPQPEPKPQPTSTPQSTSTPNPNPAPEPQPQLTPKSAPQPGTSNPSSKSEGLVEPQAESQLVQNESRQLPQTGSGQVKGVMALGIVSLLTSFGLGMKKKKNI